MIVKGKGCQVLEPGRFVLSYGVPQVTAQDQIHSEVVVCK